MTSESNRISAASIAYVDTVCRAWGWSWSEMGQADDDGFDGLVYLRKMEVHPDKPNDRRSWTHQFTGGLIQVQVKSGSSYVASQDVDAIELKVANLSTKRELWEKSPLPVALIYVKEEPVGRGPSKAWWADLKSADTYTANGTIVIPKKNRFQCGIECRSAFAKLARGQHRQLALEVLDMSVPSALPARIGHMSKSLKKAAWDFYQQWKSAGVITNPELGPVIVNRTGWSHITRVGRPVPRIETSFELLPVAARIVSTVKRWQVLRRGATERHFLDGSWAIYEYLGLSATVKWPAREQSQVMVILRRQTIFEEDCASTDSTTKVRIRARKTWFYSVYEPGRGKRKK